MSVENGRTRLYPSFSGDSTDEERRLLVNSVAETGYPEHEEHYKDAFDPKEKPKWEIFFVVMPLFCGYACLFALQRDIKAGVYHITDPKSEASHVFGTAASFVYIGNLIFRLGHNFLFAWAQPRTRVLIAMLSMAISMGLICIMFFWLHKPHIAWAFVAYIFGGTGIGTFESNVLSTITPLGKKTKFWAITAIPSGIVSVTVGGFAIQQIHGVTAGYIYAAVLLYIIVGMVVFVTRFYFLPSCNANAIHFMEFLRQLQGWRHWLPKIGWHSFALFGDMFAVSVFSPGIILYIWGETAEFPWFHGSMKMNWLMCIANGCSFLGDTISRRIFYAIPGWSNKEHPGKLATLLGARTGIVFPVFFWVFAALGIAAGVVHSAFFVPFCCFLVMFCNGSIYSQANRMIDSEVDKQYNLIAFSFWLFIGDMGSVIGSNTISYIYPSVERMDHITLNT